MKISHSRTEMPKAEYDADEWQAAIQVLLLVAEHDRPAMFRSHDVSLDWLMDAPRPRCAGAPMRWSRSTGKKRSVTLGVSRERPALTELLPRYGTMACWITKGVGKERE
jgi:hypothetical protein